ncbi:hypothetical protein BGZ83_005202 [Gryganskiella cystojenkinii]|nr:hypothetical protein BGZ83_005202 [Gryganskiella cystojenkinii]
MKQRNTNRPLPSTSSAAKSASSSSSSLSSTFSFWSNPSFDIGDDSLGQHYPTPHVTPKFNHSKRTPVITHTVSHRKHTNALDVLNAVQAQVELIKTSLYKKYAKAYDAAKTIHSQIVDIENVLHKTKYPRKFKSKSILRDDDKNDDERFCAAVKTHYESLLRDSRTCNSPRSSSESVSSPSSSGVEVSSLKLIQQQQRQQSINISNSLAPSDHSSASSPLSAEDDDGEDHSCFQSSDRKITRRHCRTQGLYNHQGKNNRRLMRSNSNRFSPIPSSLKLTTPQHPSSFSTRAPAYQPEYPSITYAPWSPAMSSCSPSPPYTSGDATTSPPYLPEDINALNPDLDPDDDHYYIQADPIYVREIDLDHVNQRQKAFEEDEGEEEEELTSQDV